MRCICCGTFNNSNVRNQCRKCYLNLNDVEMEKLLDEGKNRTDYYKRLDELRKKSYGM